MDDPDDRSNVRRLGRKDRKRRIDPRGPLFPPEEEVSGKAAESPPDAADLKPRFTPGPTPEVKARLDTPPGERFPALSFDEPDVVVPAASPAPVRARSTCLPNLVALLFFVATIVIIAVYAIITVNPYSGLNPFPPFTPIPIIVSATFLPPTATLPPTAGPTVTFTPIPIETLATPVPDFTFSLVGGAAVYAPNGNDQGCNWSSIAGTVTDANGTALDGYGVRITGNGVDEGVFSGAALTFGPGGFELFLNGTPQEKTYSVQLLSPQGAVLSDTYSITTHTACDQNVAVLTFKQIGG